MLTLGGELLLRRLRNVESSLQAGELELNLARGSIEMLSPQDVSDFVTVEL